MDCMNITPLISKCFFLLFHSFTSTCKFEKHSNKPPTSGATSAPRCQPRDNQATCTILHIPLCFPLNCLNYLDHLSKSSTVVRKHNKYINWVLLNFALQADLVIETIWNQRLAHKVSEVLSLSANDDYSIPHFFKVCAWTSSWTTVNLTVTGQRGVIHSRFLWEDLISCINSIVLWLS